MLRGSRLVRSLHLGLSAALVALGLTTIGVVAGSPARAVAPLSCSAIYALQGGPRSDTAPYDVWQVDPASGSLTGTGVAFPGLVGTSMDALGLSADGRSVYGVIVRGSERLISRYDSAAASATQVGAGPDDTPASHGAVDPATGVYYYGGLGAVAGGRGTLSVYGFDPREGALGLVARGSVPAGGAGGDWAFDDLGRLYVAAAGADTVVSVVDQVLPASRRATPLSVSASTVLGVPGATDGIAFGGQGDRRLYLADDTSIRTVDPGTGAVEGVQGLVGGAGAVDLASCAAPDTISVLSTFPEGRLDPDDRATVTITGGGLATGTPNPPAETAGPVLGLDGATYTVTETGAGATGPGYRTTYQCVDERRGTVLASGAGTTGSFTMPTGAGPSGTSVRCSFANLAQRPGVALSTTAGTITGSTAGSRVSYALTVTNTGNVALTTVSVSDPALGAVTCPAGPLPPGASRTCTAPAYVLTQDDVNRGSVSNTATVTASTGVVGLPEPTATDTAVVTIPAQPRLVLTTTDLPAVDVNGSGLVDAGDTIGYRFTLANTGNLPIAAITVRDPLLPGPVTCAATALDPGGSTTCSSGTAHTITPAEQDAGQVVNSATASGTRPGGAPYTSDPGTAVTPVQQPAPRLSVVASAGPVQDVNSDGLTDAGDLVPYAFTVANTGNVPLTTLRLVDDGVGAEVGDVTCQATALAVGASTTCASVGPYVVTAADVASGGVRTSTTARAIAPDGSVTTSAPGASVVPATAPAPGLELVKSVRSVTDVDDDGLTDSGDRIVWSFAVTNTGNVPVTGVAIDDPKAGAVGCPGGTLAVGAQTTCTSGAYVVTAADELARRVRNTATATAVDRDGRPATSPPSTTTTPASAPAPAIRLDKRAGTPVDVDGSGTVDAGDTVQWSFVVTNTGNVALVDVAVDDPALAARTPPVTVTCPATTLDPGGSTTCTASRPTVITQAEEEARVSSNTATALATDPDGGILESDPDTANVPVTTAAAVLTLVKRAAAPTDVNGNGLTDAGDTVAYAFTVTNDGNVPVAGVVVDDPMLGPVTCDKTTLGVGETAMCGAPAHTVTGLDEVNGAVRNTATARGTGPDGAVVSNPSATTTRTRIAAPGLSLDKRARTPVDRNADGLTDVGDTIVYTFVVANTGNVPVTGLQIVDPQVGVVTCPDEALAPGDIRSCTSGAYAVTAADVTAGAVVNVARATGSVAGASTISSATDSTTTPTTGSAAELALTLTGEPPVDVNGSGLVDAGDTIQYTFVVANRGNVPLTEVRVDTGLGLTVTCLDLVLPPGGSTRCRATTLHVITSQEQAAGAVINTAVARAVGPAAAPVVSGTARSEQPVATPAAALSVDKTAGTPVDRNGDALVDAGDTIVYTFTVTNTGDVPVTGVAIADPEVRGITCLANRLAVDATTTCTSAPYPVTPVDVASGAVVNVARATGTAPSGELLRSPSDSTSTATTAARRSLLLELTQATPVDIDGDGLVDAGDTIGYTVSVTNSGNVAVSGLTVATALGLPVTCEPTELAPGRVAVCTVSSPYVVTEADETSGSVINSAVAGAIGPDGSSVGSNRDVVTQVVDTPAPRLGIDKRAGVPVDVDDDGVTDAGDTLVYSFVVTNTGNVTVTDVAVVDPLVADVDCPGTTLAVGGSLTCRSEPYVVTEDDEVAGAVRNRATAVGSDPDGDPVTSTADSVSTPVETPAPALTLDKRARRPVDLNGSGTTDAGDTVQFVFTVGNVGNVPITDVGVDDPLAGAVTCAATTLAPAVSTTCAADEPYTVTAEQEAAEVLSNTATAAGTASGQPVVSDPDTVNVPLTPGAPVLTLAKRAGAPVDANGDGLADLGDTIAYAFTVTNDGNVTLRDVTVADPLTGAVTCERTILAPASSTTCVADAAYVITPDDQRAGVVRNTAGATARDPDGGAVTSNPDSTTTTLDLVELTLQLEVTQQPVVDVNRSGLTDAGDTVGYTYAVTNIGNVPLTDLRVVDSLGLPVTCGATGLVAGATTECASDTSYVVTEADEVAGSVVDYLTIANAVGPYGLPVTSNPDTTTLPVQTPAPSLSVDKAAGAPVDLNASGLTDAGDTIGYSFLVTNTGNVPLTEVRVVDAEVDGVTCPVDRTTPLAVEATATCTSTPYRVTQADETAGSADNRATAAAQDPDGGAVVSAPDTTSTPVAVPAPSLSVDKVAGEPVDVNESGLADAGDTIAYSFFVTNTGNVPISGVTILDPRVEPAPCGETVLAVGEGTTCTAAPYVVTDADQDAGAALNVARVSGADPDGGVVVSASDATSTPLVRPVAALTVDKRAGTPGDVNGSGITDTGDTVDYSFVVTNTGNVPLAALRVVDPLVGSVTCESATLAPGDATTCTTDTAYVVTDADVEAGVVVNTATAIATPPDGRPVTSAPGRANVETTRPEPSLSLDKKAYPDDRNDNDVGDEGEVIDYTFVVRNTGNVVLDAVSVADPLVGAVTCAPGALAPGESVDCASDQPYEIIAEDISVGSVTNVATAAANDPDDESVVSEPDQTTTPTLQAEPELSLDKWALLDDTNGDGLASLGETVIFKFRVSNRGNVDLDDVGVVDDSTGTVGCPLTTLHISEETTCEAAPYLVTAADVAVGSVTNIATVTATVTASAAGREEQEEVRASSPADSTATPTVKVEAVDRAGPGAGPVRSGGEGGNGILANTGGPSVWWLYLGAMLLLVGSITLMAGLVRRHPFQD